MRATIQQIQSLIHQGVSELSIIDSKKTNVKPAPDRWSKKEILGHLIDSALNNHQRCVRAGYNVAKEFPAYDQNEWVRIQYYNELSWHDMIRFWNDLNQHLCNVIKCLPEEAQSVSCNIGKEEPVILKYVVEDYARHLQHHLEQILDKKL